MRRAAAALCAIAALLAIAAPAGAATRQQIQRLAFSVPSSGAAVRDVVIDRSTRKSAQVLARSPMQRTPVNDGAGRSVEITVSPLCDPLINCQDADPQAIANFLGSLAHGDEMNLLTVDLQPGFELAATCGSAAAQACYFPAQNLMIINGNDTTASDGATRDFVIAHEYGHHLANNRNNAPFDNPAVDWGPKRWASYHRVCQGVAAKAYFPGAQTMPRYFQNPGEAFAEAFAFNRFPTAPVPWAWTASLRPDANSFAAIQRDALDPWNGATTDTRRGRFGKKKRPRKKRKRIATPLDGNLTVSTRGTERANFDLVLRDFQGRLLERSEGAGSRESVRYLLCGEQGVTAWVRRHGRKKARFRVIAQVP